MLTGFWRNLKGRCNSGGLEVRLGGGVPQPNGEMMAEPRFDVAHVGKAILDMSNLPLDTNVLFMTIMATNMPYVGRG